MHSERVDNYSSPNIDFTSANMAAFDRNANTIRAACAHAGMAEAPRSVLTSARRLWLGGDRIELRDKKQRNCLGQK